MNSIKTSLDGSGLRIGIVQSRFNQPVVTRMLQACVDALKAASVRDVDIDHVSVPGALEIPVALQTMALTHQYDALIAIGAVIILFLVFEPDGLAHRWRQIKAWWKLYPFSH